MKANEILGIDPLPCNVKLTENRPPVSGTISLTFPLLYALLYMFAGTRAGSGAGLGFFLLIGTGGALVSSTGVLFAFVSLVRNERMPWLFFIGLALNLPIFIFTASLSSEVFRLFR